MKYAIIDGKKVEAAPKAKGFCPSCKSELIARCGEFRVNHWAHKGNPPCDPWWENETEWHRAWKNVFPKDWQEVIHRADGGEKHIADVKTNKGWVLEFQHSFLKPEERRARDAFYSKLVWVVDGTRRQRDRSQFIKVLNEGSRINAKPPILSVFTDECTLLKEWTGCRAPVFFDFGSDNNLKDVRLWCLLPGSTDQKAYIGTILRATFINLHLEGNTQMWQDFVEFYQKFSKVISSNNAHPKTQILYPLYRLPQNAYSRRRPQSYRQYIARKLRARRQRRF